MSVPYKEEAWIQFENYSDEHHISQKRTSLPAINFNINRTLILPFVFGGVIIGFSLLLFNFINIKNKPAEALASNKMQEEPKKQEQATVVPIENKIVDAAKAIPTETVAEIKQDTVKPQPPVITNTVAVNPTTTPTVAAITNNPPAGTWTSPEPLQVYESPNIASKVLGTAGKNQNYTALEETNYFIKIVSDGKTGFVRKHLMRKNGQSSVAGGSNTVRKKPKQAEVLESIQAPVKISEDAEPELK
jgi:hypothetical protein